MHPPAAPPSDQLEALVRQYSRLVHSVVRKIGGPAAVQLGDDVEQLVFLEIWKQIEREQEIEHPTSYIYRAAVRETVRALKRERRHQRLAARVARDHTDESGTDYAAAGAVGASSMNSPDQVLQSRDVGTQIEKVLDTLLPRRQKAVRAHLAGFDVREIMQLQGWSYHRARNLIARGMADLRKGLKERGIHE